MPDPLAERGRERQELIETARAYVERLGTRLELEAAFLVGSVARGDFNVWSDIDVVVVAKELPERGLERIGLLLEDAPARIQPVGFTPLEFAAAKRRRNPLATEAATLGIDLTKA